MNGDFEAKLRSLLSEGQKIEAVKLYREEFGVGLAEAKEAVDALEQGESLTPRVSRTASAIEEEVLSLLEQGRKIEAIKIYREHSGKGLKESKEAVEALAVERGIPSGSGCFGGILLGLLILAGLGFPLWG